MAAEQTTDDDQPLPVPAGPSAFDQFPPSNWYDANGQWIDRRTSAGAQEPIEAQWETPAPGHEKPSGERKKEKKADEETPRPVSPMGWPPTPFTPRPASQRIGMGALEESPAARDPHDALMSLPPDAPPLPLPPTAQPHDLGTMPEEAAGPAPVPDAISGGQIQPASVAEALGQTGQHIAPVERNVVTPDQQVAAFDRLSPEEQNARLQRVQDAHEDAAYRQAYAAAPPANRAGMLTPDEREAARTNARREQARHEKLANDTLVAERERSQSLLLEQAARSRAYEDNRRKRLDIEQKMLELAKQKPVETLPIGRSIAGVIASAVGGFFSHYTGGRNLALEGFEKSIDRHVAAQQQGFAQQRQALALQGQSLNEQEAEDQHAFSDKNIIRAQVYDSAIRQAQIEAQQFDPHGTAAAEVNKFVADTAAKKQLAMQAWQEKDLKDRTDAYKAQWEGAAKRATVQKELAGPHGTPTPIKGEILNPFTGQMENYGGGPVGGGGGAGNTKATVSTGIYTPYRDESGNFIEIKGTHPIDVKGHEKEFAGLSTRIQGYGHEQDYFKQLKDIGAKIDYHKNVLHDWDKTQATLVDEYDKATHALVVYLTKDLGDKLTQGQIDEQSKRIPALTKWLSQVDVKAEIEHAQEMSDRDLERDANVFGMDVHPMIRIAQKYRAPAAEPESKDRVLAAQGALAKARSPEEKRAAQAELDAANKASAAEIKDTADAGRAIETQSKMAKLGGLWPTFEQEGMPADVRATMESHRTATESYVRALHETERLKASPPKPTGQVGVDARAMEEHEKKLAKAAIAARDARDVVRHSALDVLESAADNLDDLPAAKRKALEAIADEHGSAPGLSLSKRIKRLVNNDPAVWSRVYDLLKVQERK
jgi:hypothetical protein